MEKFWECWHNIPKPSEVFGDGNRKVTVGGFELRSYGLFKKGIIPTWEDKGNEHGFQIEAVRNFHAEAVDVQWENTVLALVGEMVDENDIICGARVVNQAKKGKGGHQYKVEVWLRRKDETMAKTLSTRLGELLSDVDRTKPSLKLTAEEFRIERRPSAH
ncbi:eukaryotic translation initiation factor EIF4E family protein [archaeon]|nr:MAG: eukaryotic translation initiation factor EIF4E family protein [archaeon]